MTSPAEQIHRDLDLDFSDQGAPGENVRLDTIEERGDDLMRAIRLMHAEEAIHYSLLQALGHEKPSPQIYALDFPSDLRASLYVLLGGYYKQALLCLRNWMEIRLLGIYFDRVDGSKYTDWKEGKTTHKDKLFGTGPIRALFNLPKFKAADGKHGLSEHLMTLYGESSVFLHGAGVEKYNLQRDTDNVPRYNTSSVALYFDLERRIWSAVTYCLWLAYGKDALRDAGPDTVQTIIAELPESFLGELQSSLPG